MLLRTISVFLAAYLLLIIVIYVQQKHLLYIPDKNLPDQKQLTQLGLKLWPQRPDYKAVISQKHAPKNQGTIIVFHGNAAAAWQRHYYITALEQYGYRVMLAEYPGYGGRDGELSETSFVNDAVATIDAAYAEFGGPLYLWGESLGCAVVSGAAAKTDTPIEGIALITPWDTLPDFAQAFYWYIPARWLAKDQYNNIENLDSFKGPIAVLIAEHDEMIPNKLSLRLFNSLQESKQLWRFASGHNDWPSSAHENWWQQVMQFLSGQQLPAKADK
jgi:hypothetical protein